MPRVHPPTERDAAIIANAVRFDIALFIGRGKYAHASARTLAEARTEAAPALEAEHPYGRRALIYAIDAEGRSALVTGDIPTESQESSMKAYAKKFNAQRAARAAGLKDNEFEIVKAKGGFTWRDLRNTQLTPDPSREPRAKGGPHPTAPKRPPGQRAQIEADARAGKLPEPPDFSAETHKRFRNKLATVVALANAGDLEGLRAFQINPVSSSPKAIKRYRDLCIIALEARRN
ncbi:hypothetical protein [Pseudorhodoplanes sp.]|uniref:hypothetical protein n=1 Tax=Pseudorhodoplanes sp. TaxID=1934341 RepID=UPI00391D1AA3